jgi:hypothetical protein
VECFKPFLRHLVSSGPSRKTLRSHRDNLWILGGEIISKLHEVNLPRFRGHPTVWVFGVHNGKEAPTLRAGIPPADD